MLKDAGASAVIAGHSERRWYYGEFDALVAAKAGAMRRAGLFAIVCVGEMESAAVRGRRAVYKCSHGDDRGGSRYGLRTALGDRLGSRADVARDHANARARPRMS